jgi:hypothetical protein
MIPMVLDPSTASIMIKYFGVQIKIGDEVGMAPSAALFFAAGILSVLTLIPTYFASKNQTK